jgi:hypothetical protein
MEFKKKIANGNIPFPDKCPAKVENPHLKPMLSNVRVRRRHLTCTFSATTSKMLIQKNREPVLVISAKWF